MPSYSVLVALTVFKTRTLDLYNLCYCSLRCETERTVQQRNYSKVQGGSFLFSDDPEINNGYSVSRRMFTINLILDQILSLPLINLLLHN